MNKKILCFILFFIILSITIIGCISNANNKENEESKEALEIGYIESKLTTLFNSLNNITFENYNITVSKINEQSESSSQSSANGANKKEETQNKNSNEQASESSGSDSSSSSDSSSKQSGGEESGSSSSSEGGGSSNKQYKFERVGVLTKEDNVDWDTIKNETELMYSIVPVVTLDLYNKNVSQEDILSFNREIDNLAQAVKKEDKEETLKTLSSLYSYLPKYSRVISNDKQSLLLETKSNIFYAYSLLDKEDWEQIQNYIKKAIECYTRILNNIDDGENNSTINKCYILLNELNNAVSIQSKDIFLIKYKNLLEELNTL